MNQTQTSAPVDYMQRMRDYYLALGYNNPYQWAYHESVPFQALKKPVTQSRIGLVTTAAPLKADAGDQGPGAPYNAAAKFYRVYAGDATRDDFLGISHVSYDRDYTTADDIGSYFPLTALRSAKADGHVGELSPRFYGLPTNRSQATTLNQDCADLLAMLQKDEVDLAIMVAN
jgi:D-proline reductase (dithiol) PrdB